MIERSTYLIGRTAIKDLLHDRRLSVASVLLFTLLLLPTLLIYILSFGAIAAWADALSQDPYSRELTMQGQESLTFADIAEIAALPGAGFVVPEALHIVNEQRARRVVPERGPWEPSMRIRTTADDDPVLEGAPAPDVTQIALSAAAAEALEAGVGDTVLLMASRQPKDTSPEPLRLEFEVIYVANSTVWPGKSAFIAPAIALGIERWSSFDLDTDEQVRALDANAQDNRWGSVRIYAADVFSAVGLRRSLEGLGYEITLRESQVQTMSSLQTGLQYVFNYLLGMSVISFGLCALLLQWLNVRRKRGDLAFLAVSGFKLATLRFFPIVQGLFTGLSAFAIACISSLALARPVGAFVAGFVEQDSILLPPVGHFVVAGFLVAGLSLLGSLGAVQFIGRLDITDAIRKD